MIVIAGLDCIYFHGGTFDDFVSVRDMVKSLTFFDVIRTVADLIELLPEYQTGELFDKMHINGQWQHIMRRSDEWAT